MGDSHGTRIAVIAALIGNGGIAIAKFLAALVSGSVSLFAETAHSIADTFNQVFLLIGLQRAKRPADAQHPFGYGKARFFWSFVTAITLFVVGGFYSVYEGVNKFLSPAGEAVDPYWGYVVLSIALVFEGASLAVALRAAAAHTKGKGGIVKGLRKSADTTLITVIFEDAAALVGLVLAFFGLYLAEKLHNPAIDGLFSIFIGIVLFAVAVYLARRSRDFLIGKGVPPKTKAMLERVIGSHPAIVGVKDVLTMYLSPDDILVVAHVDFADHYDAGYVEKAIEDIEKELMRRMPKIKHVYIEPERQK